MGLGRTEDKTVLEVTDVAVVVTPTELGRMDGVVVSEAKLEV